eukprot:4606519-Amphidinium_carterae.1
MDVWHDFGWLRNQARWTLDRPARPVRHSYQGLPAARSWLPSEFVDHLACLLERCDTFDMI